MKIQKPSKELVEEFKQISTSSISDALNRFGIKGGCQGIYPVIPGKKMVGTALTARKIPADPVNPKKGGGNYLDIAEEGDVIVIDNGGRTDGTVWGDILTEGSIQKGCAGTLIYGCCRDISRLRELGYPVFSKGVYMQTGKDFTQYENINIPVGIYNVLVNPGDIIIGDDSGVVVVPKSIAKKVIEAAKEIKETEDHIVDSAVKGLDTEDAHLTLDEARKKYGYWDLQKQKK